MILGVTIELAGWQYGFLLPISLVITAAFIPMGRIFCREMKEIVEIRR